MRGTSAPKSRFTKREDYADNWEEISRAVKKRDGYRCQYHRIRGGKPCGVYAPPPFHGQLHAHHIHFKGKGGSDNPKNLVTLCHRHHNAMHSHK